MRIQYPCYCYFSYSSPCLYKKTGNNQDNHTATGHTDISKHTIKEISRMSAN